MKNNIKFSIKFILLNLIVFALLIGLCWLFIESISIPKSARSEGTFFISQTNIGVEILEINDSSVIVKPIYDVPKYSSFSPDYENEYEFLHTDRLEINLEKVNTICDLEVGKIVNILYNFKDGTKGTDPIVLKTVEKIEESTLFEDCIQYNGRSYEKRYLSEDTLKWLEMSEEERANWDYYPEELLKKGSSGISLANEIREWGIFAKVENVTPMGMTVVFTQEDFIPTTLNDNWQISIDNSFTIEKLKGYTWIPANLLGVIVDETDLLKDTEVSMIKMNGITTYDVHWKGLYGKLSKGEYCLILKISVLKEVNECEEKKIYLRFSID